MSSALMLSVSGCRGTFGGSLTPEVIARFASALAAHVKAGRKARGRPTIAVAYDGRAKSENVYDIAASTLKLCGCNVVFMGVEMTPTVGFAVDRLGADAGLQITASHNPQNWCGMKPIVRASAVKKGAVNASAPDKATADAIISRFNAGAPGAAAQWQDVGEPRIVDWMGKDHAAAAGKLLHDAGVIKAVQKARFRVALDAVAGSGTERGPFFLKALGCKVHELYPYARHLNGVFPHTPEPTRENLKALCAATKKSKAHVGFAVDPDADRLAVVDEKGSYIGEEYTLVLAALAMGEMGLLRKGNTIAVNLSTSRMIEDVAAGMGCKVVRSAVGEANVVAAMRMHKCPLGGEGNGGVIVPAVTYIRDSFSAMALVLGLMAMRKQPLSAIVASIPAYAIEKRKVDLRSRDEAASAGEKVSRHYSTARIDRQDGVRVDLDDRRAWLHVRASNTEPIMRLIAEAPTAAEAAGLLDEAAKVIAG